MNRHRPGENPFTEEWGTVNSSFTIKIEMLLGWGGWMGRRGANAGKTKNEKAKGEEPQGSEDSVLRFLRMGVWGAAVLRPYAEDRPDRLTGRGRSGRGDFAASRLRCSACRRAFL